MPRTVKTGYPLWFPPSIAKDIWLHSNSFCRPLPWQNVPDKRKKGEAAAPPFIAR
jgi:hypothetical protein